MPLSPLHSRLALAGFLCIGAGVAFNLLALQEREGELPHRRPLLSRAPTTAERDRLDRLAREASQPTGRSLAEMSQTDEQDVVMRRVGSFSPTSGQLTAVALPAADQAETRRATVRAIQSELARRGYEPGPPDGAPGLVTKAAVMAYEQDHGLPVTGEPSADVLAHLKADAPGPARPVPRAPSPQRSGASVEQVIRAAQAALRDLGYLTAPADDIASEATARAIRAFELKMGLVPSGRITGGLMARLLQQTGPRQPG